VAQICARLDGIPLAIELAAARIGYLSPFQIAERLSDRFHLLASGSRTALPRHQALRSTIDWSYDLLPPAEQRLFDRLSVFAGGWTLEAAETVCANAAAARGAAADAGSPLAADVFELLGHLVDKSLVSVELGLGGERHYRLLDTLRQYAAERLQAAADAEAVRDRHAAYFGALAEAAEWGLQGADNAL
jgi:predicted ATPase